MPDSPLTDLVRFLNTRSDALSPQSRLKTPFLPSETGAFAHFAGLRLESRYLRIVDTASGQLHGHTAALWAEGLSTRRRLPADAVFVLPTDDAEFVYLDRLLRTLHALNYLTQQPRGNLVLNVHQRHVLSVPAKHGLAFEELLRPVGLLPTQVTLEVDIFGVTQLDKLAEAIGNYRSRGYGIALAGVGQAPIDFSLLRTLQPTIVKLDPLLLPSPRPLRRIASQLHELGARILADGLDTPALRNSAFENGIDLLQMAADCPVAGIADPSTISVKKPVDIS